ncbi:ferrochelatase [Microbacterium luticocti]|uniref:ferrochelatase n=1 Tax=Microbacterium luticocti TaxID=451764 RepID=UPI0004178F3B|nr:ferrochelatase [Microbacterium luticocti]
MSAGGFDAVLLASFGGPEGQDDVIPFLRNVTRGRGVPDERLEEVAVHYRHFGGVSPINAQNRALKAALEAEIAARGLDLPVYWGNRNWHPYFADAVRAAHADGNDRLLAVVTSAYTSYSGVGQYRENFEQTLADTGLAGVVSIDRLREFFDHPGFVAPFVEGLRAALGEAEAAGAHVLFVTHSIPDAAAVASGPEYGPGGAYVAQHLAVADVIAAQAAPGVPYSLCYQSRSGDPRTPWLEPDVNDEIRRLAAAGVRRVVVVPIGFVSDHMEVLWDLDTEAAETAAEVGVGFARVPTPGVHPAFVAGLVDLIQERVDRTPDAERAHLTDLGPWPDHETVGVSQVETDLPADARAVAR